MAARSSNRADSHISPGVAQVGGRGAGGAEHLQGRHTATRAEQSAAELYLEEKMTKMHQFMQQGNKAECCNWEFTQ